jgi:hypothetical protein
VFVVSIIREDEKEERRQVSAFGRLVSSVVTRRRWRCRGRVESLPDSEVSPDSQAELRQKGTSAMITFLGAFLFATVIVIGALDRNNGLRLLQKYESPWHADPRRDPSRPARRRRRARGT